MPSLKEIIAFILHGEGLKLNAYKCSAGVWTIGIGSTYYKDGRAVKEGDKITEKEAFELAEFIAARFAKTVSDSLKVCVSSNQFLALVSLCYNVGEPRFRRSILLKAVNNCPNDKAIKEIFLMSFITENGIKSKGLINRRTSEAKQYFKI